MEGADYENDGKDVMKNKSNYLNQIRIPPK